MTFILRTACAALVLSFAAQAGAQETWINSDTTSRENKLGSVVLLELGTTASCIVCRTPPAPMRGRLEAPRRDVEPDFYDAIARRRAGGIRQQPVDQLLERRIPLSVESGKRKGPDNENSQHDADTPHLR